MPGAPNAAEAIIKATCWVNSGRLGAPLGAGWSNTGNGCLAWVISGLSKRKVLWRVLVQASYATGAIRASGSALAAVDPTPQPSQEDPMKPQTIVLALLSGLCVSAMANGVIGGNQNGLGPGGYLPQPPASPFPPPPTDFPPQGVPPVHVMPPPPPAQPTGAVNTPAAAPIVKVPLRK